MDYKQKQKEFNNKTIDSLYENISKQIITSISKIQLKKITEEGNKNGQ